MWFYVVFGNYENNKIKTFVFVVLCCHCKLFYNILFPLGNIIFDCTDEERIEKYISHPLLFIYFIFILKRNTWNDCYLFNDQFSFMWWYFNRHIKIHTRNTKLCMNHLKRNKFYFLYFYPHPPPKKTVQNNGFLSP